MEVLKMSTDIHVRKSFSGAATNPNRWVVDCLGFEVINGLNKETAVAIANALAKQTGYKVQVKD